MSSSAEKRLQQQYNKYHKQVCDLLGFDPSVKTDNNQAKFDEQKNEQKMKGLHERIKQNNEARQLIIRKAKEPTLADTEQQLLLLKNQIRKKKLQQRKSSQRPPSQTEYKKADVPKDYNCKKYIENKLRENGSNETDQDPLEIISVYRKMQPCPLRSSIEKLKMFKDNQTENQDFQDFVEQKKINQKKFDYISNFIHEQKSEILESNKVLHLRIVTEMMNQAQAELQRVKQRSDLKNKLSTTDDRSIRCHSAFGPSASLTPHQVPLKYTHKNEVKNNQIQKIPRQSTPVLKSTLVSTRLQSARFSNQFRANFDLSTAPDNPEDLVTYAQTSKASIGQLSVTNEIQSIYNTVKSFAQKNERSAFKRLSSVVERENSKLSGSVKRGPCLTIEQYAESLGNKKQIGLLTQRQRPKKMQNYEVASNLCNYFKRKYENSTERGVTLNLKDKIDLLESQQKQLKLKYEIARSQKRIDIRKKRISSMEDQLN